MLFSTLQVVFPIFATVGVGYGFGYIGLLNKHVGDTLSTFCITVLIPVLIFRTLATSDLGGLSPWALWGTYYTALMVTAVLGGYMVRKVFGREARAACIGGFSASFSNTSLIGIPLITSAFGPEALIPLSLIISIHAPSVTLVFVLAMERAVVVDGYWEARPLRHVMQSLFKTLITSPLVVAVLLGVGWNLSGFELPALLDGILLPLASAASPVALFSVGMTLLNYGVRGNIAIGGVLSLLKILLMPAIVLVLGIYVFPLSPLWVAVATLVAACPTGVVAYLYASQFGTGHAMSANSISLTTIFSIITMSFWIWVLEFLGY
ncbi:transporter [Pseudovibrio japonicus]|uniref:Transporter n=1 Tax=Pseudovibrio japonicus TaxID=366534 RepID=A0ABQ3E6U7_9HYPH|nr:AEC family transporter [Pseudovibrio japonicus]GHB27945.1 transporter [Pseudovibrio japonicus]